MGLGTFTLPVPAMPWNPYSLTGASFGLCYRVAGSTPCLLPDCKYCIAFYKLAVLSLITVFFIVQAFSHCDRHRVRPTLNFNLVILVVFVVVVVVTEMRVGRFLEQKAMKPWPLNFRSL